MFSKIRKRPDIMGEKNPMFRLEVKEKHLKAVRNAKYERKNLFQKGNIHPPEILEKMRKSSLWRKGKLAGNWQGGKTKLFKRIRNSSKFINWRKSIFERDKYRCIKCGIKGDKAYLQADHIKPFAYFPKLRFSLDNGRTLCRECHKKTDTYGYKVFLWKPNQAQRKLL